MAKPYPLSPLGPSHHESEISLTTVHEKGKFYNGTAGTSEFGRSCTTLANEQVHKNSVLHWWWMEIGASVLSIVTMVALVAVLAHQDGKPLQSWDHGNITINTVVAAISTLNRISFMFPVSGAISQAMWIWFASKRKHDKCQSRIGDLEIFDEASRGAWGSMLLLWRLKTTVHLATIGAILTIASLAFDIFTQQVLGYQTLNIAGNNTTGVHTVGDVPRLENYGQYTHGAAMNLWIPTLSAKAALRNSFFANSVSTLDIPCSTGNCTWPIVPSLAVCGECSATTYTKTCYRASEFSTFDTCNYTTPSGASVSVADEELSLNMVFWAERLTNGTIYNMSDPNIPYIAVFDAMYSPYPSPKPTPTWDNISATQCALWFCMQAYDTSINDSSTVEKSTNWSTILPIEDAAYNYTGLRQFTDVPKSMNVAPNSTYTILGASMRAWQYFTFTEQMFFGNISASAANTDASSDYMIQLWSESADLDSWIKRMSMGVTNYLRTISPHTYDTDLYNGTAHPYYRGTAYFTEIHVKVRWEWLTFPLGLIALSVLFLVLSIIRTRGSHIGAWKSSPLALLFADVDGVIRAQAGNTMNMAGGLDESVGETRALLKPELGGRWVFRTAGIRS